MCVCKPPGCGLYQNSPSRFIPFYPASSRNIFSTIGCNSREKRLIIQSEIQIDHHSLIHQIILYQAQLYPGLLSLEGASD